MFWVSWLSSFTIELAVMFSKMSHGVVGVLQTELALAKVCQLELGHNESVCSHLNNHTDIETEVQARVNMFQVTGELMCQVPTIIYALLAGTISDRFGRKPLMVTVRYSELDNAVRVIISIT